MSAVQRGLRRIAAAHCSATSLAPCASVSPLQGAGVEADELFVSFFSFVCFFLFLFRSAFAAGVALPTLLGSTLAHRPCRVAVCCCLLAVAAEWRQQGQRQSGRQRQRQQLHRPVASSVSALLTSRHDTTRHRSALVQSRVDVSTWSSDWPVTQRPVHQTGRTALQRTDEADWQSQWTATAAAPPRRWLTR